MFLSLASLFFFVKHLLIFTLYLYIRNMKKRKCFFIVMTNCLLSSYEDRIKNIKGVLPIEEAKNFYRALLSCHPCATQQEKELVNNNWIGLDDVVGFAKSVYLALEKECMSIEGLERVLLALESELDGAKSGDQSPFNSIVLPEGVSAGDVLGAMSRLSPSITYQEYGSTSSDSGSPDLHGAGSVVGTGIFYSVSTIGTSLFPDASHCDRSDDRLSGVNRGWDSCNTSNTGTGTISMASTAMFLSVNSSRCERSGHQFGVANRGGQLGGAPVRASSAERFCCISNPFMGRGVDAVLCPTNNSRGKMGDNRHSFMERNKSSEVVLPALNNSCGGSNVNRSTRTCDISTVLPNIFAE